jgi:zinc transport system substrate-binding protein
MQLTNALKPVLLTLIFAVSVPALADVNVVTTIRPLEFIAKAVIGELGSTDSLIGRNASPHHFNFTPSNRRALNRADIVLWVGPEFEVHISENMERLVKGRPLLTAFDLADLKLLYLAESSGKDGHVWLSSHNAKVIASELAAQLAVIDPTNATAFAANLQQFKASLDVSNKAIQARLIAYKSTAYLVYHNGFQYFEQEQGLQHLLPLVLDPEVSPSINQIVAVRKKIEATQPKCLISEADANADLANTFTRGVEMKIVEVDLLGYNIPLSTQAYIELLESVADSYTSCLSAAD